MGLDVVAISKARFKDSNWKDGEEGENEHSVHKAEFNRMDGLPEGIYEALGEQFHFRAGSYSGYNQWRRQLALTFARMEPEVIWNHDDHELEAPFVELINFSDCDGAIGPATSKKLAKDFDDYVGVAGEQMDEYDFRIYLNFLHAFTIAADDGFVIFG